MIATEGDCMGWRFRKTRETAVGAGVRGVCTRRANPRARDPGAHLQASVAGRVTGAGESAAGRLPVGADRGGDLDAERGGGDEVGNPAGAARRTAGQRAAAVRQVGAPFQPLERLAATLRKIHISKSEFFSQSVRGGTQTDGNLFQRIEPEIIATREALRQVIAEHAAELPPVDPSHPHLRHRPSSIGFTGAWSVRLTGGGQHANHTHPMGWLSSALYIVLPAEIGANQAGWLALGEPPTQLKLELPASHMIEPVAGRLALFPSWMWHGTRPFAQGERLTIAFDVAR